MTEIGILEKRCESENQLRLMLASIPLCQLGTDKKPIDFGSGCLVDYCGKRFLLSVHHVVEDQCNWAIQVEYDLSIGQTRLYPLSPANPLKSGEYNDENPRGELSFLTNLVKHGDLSPKRLCDVEFYYDEVPVDLQPRFQVLSISGEILHDTPRIILQPDFELEPSKHECYGFAGHVKNNLKDEVLTSMPVVHSNLRYVGKKKDSYVFAFPGEKPAPEHLHGCSGSPIMDSDGNCVALLSSSYPNDDNVYGTAISHYKVLLDIEVGNIEM